MEIDVQKIAELSRLKIDKKNEETLKAQMQAIFKYFEEIRAVDTTGVEPLITPSDIELWLRDDQVKEMIKPDAAVANAPEKSGNLFRVPPVVG